MTSAVSLPDPVVRTRFYTLRSDISAMQILPPGDAGVRMSPVCRLPRGADIQALGEGFDSQTLKVLYEGQYYYVFLDDLSPQRMAAARAS